MSDISQLIGRPYADIGDPPRSFNCWQLVVHVRACLGLPVPVIPGAIEARMTADLLAGQPRGAAAAVEGILTPVATPSTGAIAFMRDDHCGIVIDGGVLHAAKLTRAGAVRHDPVEVAGRMFGRLTFWEVAAHG
jgi:hypothetical protein